MKRADDALSANKPLGKSKEQRLCVEPAIRRSDLSGSLEA
jgi:hypothetical protein